MSFYILEVIWGFPKIRGTILGGSDNKDYSILGSMLGSHYFGKLPYSESLRSMYMIPPKVDRIWLRVDDNKIPLYPIFYVPTGDYNPKP